jgi:hypothetical protein
MLECLVTKVAHGCKMPCRFQFFVCLKMSTTAQLDRCNSFEAPILMWCLASRKCQNSHSDLI